MAVDQLCGRASASSRRSGDALGVVAVAQAVQQHREFVGADARRQAGRRRHSGRCGRWAGAGSASGCARRSAPAGGRRRLAERVVDLAEAVAIHEQQGEAGAARRARQHLLQLFEHGLAVRHAGQGVGAGRRLRRRRRSVSCSRCTRAVASVTRPSGARVELQQDRATALRRARRRRRAQRQAQPSQTTPDGWVEGVGQWRSCGATPAAR
jgi:hypothetical protein